MFLYVFHLERMDFASSDSQGHWYNYVKGDLMFIYRLQNWKIILSNARVLRNNVARYVARQCGKQQISILRFHANRPMTSCF